MMRFLSVVITPLCVILLVLSGCGSSQAASAGSGDEILFSRDVLPLLQEKFAPLLGDETGLVLDSWSDLIRGSEHGEVLIPFDAERSLLVELAVHAGAGLVTQEEIDLVRRWIEEGARNDDGAVPYADATDLVYVSNQGSAVVSVVDTESNVVIRTIDLQDLGFSANAKPHHIAVEPDGEHWYVSLIGENTVLKFDRDNELVGRIPFEVPGMLALDDADNDLYVGRSMSAVNPPQRIGFVGDDALEVEELDIFYPRPHALELTRDGRYLYSASLALNQMASIDTETMEVEIHQVPGPHHSLVQFAVAPDGNMMIGGGEMSGRLLFFDISDPMNPVVVDSLDLGGSPWHPILTADGGTAYVPRKTANAISVVDMDSREQTAVITGQGLSQPHGSALRPDGRYLYVSSNNLDGGYTPRHEFGGDPSGTLVVIDTETNQIVKVLELENYPTGVGSRRSH